MYHREHTMSKPMFEIIQGDALSELRSMPTASIQMVCTSPPYWNLRDYSTGTWEGGDTACDHVEGTCRRDEGKKTWDGGECHGGIKYYRDQCRKCGARRIDQGIGLESTLEEYLANMVAVFCEVKRVLRDDGTAWVNMGDKRNNTCTEWLGMPHELRKALQGDGWFFADEIVWHKPNPMPEATLKRTTRSYEYVFLMTKRWGYYYDADAVRERRQGSTHSRGNKRRPPIESAGIGHKDWSRYMTADEQLTSRNLRSVWTIPTEAFPGAFCTACKRYYGKGTARLRTHVNEKGKENPICSCGRWNTWLSHFATFPRRLVTPCIKAGTSERGCCPECGAGWKRVVERDRQPTRPGRDNKQDETGLANRDAGRHVTETRTIGWQPGCKCGGEMRDDGKWHGQPYKPLAPCTVLDPFCGSGTVGVVATQLGCRFIGVELNPDYAEMARRRIENPEPELELPDLEGQMQMEYDDVKP